MFTQLRTNGWENNLHFPLSYCSPCSWYDPHQLSRKLWSKGYVSYDDQISVDMPIAEQVTTVIDRQDVMNTRSHWETLNMHDSGMKSSLVKDYLRILNTTEKDKLGKLKGIGEKRAT
jgi:hypothetical protein